MAILNDVRSDIGILLYPSAASVVPWGWQIYPPNYVVCISGNSKEGSFRNNHVPHLF